MLTSDVPFTDEGTTGAVKNDYVKPIYMDVSLPAGESFEQQTNPGDNGFLFVIDGDLEVGDSASVVGTRTLGILGEGSRVRVKAGTEDARFLLVSAQPLNEPVARGGPFVMNTKEEIIQAFDDFRHNRF